MNGIAKEAAASSVSKKTEFQKLRMHTKTEWEEKRGELSNYIERKY
jgi:hypothetical protein